MECDLKSGDVIHFFGLELTIIEVGESDGQIIIWYETEEHGKSWVPFEALEGYRRKT